MRLPLLLTAWHLFQCDPAPDSMPVVRLQPEPCTGLCCHSQVARPVTMPAPPKTRIQVGTGTFLPGTAAFCLRSGRSRWNGQGEARVGWGSAAGAPTAGSRQAQARPSHSHAT